MAEDEDLAGRIDGVARALMYLIADLELREQLDGARFCADLRQARMPNAASRRALHALASELDAARAVRLAARTAESRGRRK